MEVYNSEQDQVEALKAWWDKWGKLVIVGIIALLVGVFGWRNWVDRQVSMADAASLAYYQMVEIAPHDSDTAMEIGRQIVGEFSSTIYARMAAMQLARLAVEQGQLETAEAHLRSVAEQRGLPELQTVARLRLAKVLMAQARYAEALTVLEHDGGSIQAAYDELRGDLLLAQGDSSAAVEAYRSALSAMLEAPAAASLVEMKLADLGADL